MLKVALNPAEWARSPNADEDDAAIFFFLISSFVKYFMNERLNRHAKLDVVGKRPSISGWGDKAREVNAFLGDELQEDKRTEFQKIEDMGLPCYKRFRLPIKIFLKSPNNYLNTIKINDLISKKEKKLLKQEIKKISNTALKFFFKILYVQI